MPATRVRGAPGRWRILDWTDDGDEFVRTPQVSCNGSRRGRLHAAGAGRQDVPVRLCPGGRVHGKKMPSTPTPAWAGAVTPT